MRFSGVAPGLSAPSSAAELSCEIVEQIRIEVRQEIYRLHDFIFGVIDEN